MRVRVWDLPTRLFHWSFAICVSGAILYANLGGAWMPWHFRCGYAVITLLMFRIAWGFVGPRYARFASFPPDPRGTLAYLKTGVARTLGHQPLAAWSVYALIVVILAQALGGLFSRDDDDHAGALQHLISNATSDAISDLHSANAWTIYLLVGLHLAAIFWYAAFRREPLIEPMLTGDKDIDSDLVLDPPAEDDVRVLSRAAAIFAACAAIVWAAVTKL